MHHLNPDSAWQVHNLTTVYLNKYKKNLLGADHDLSNVK